MGRNDRERHFRPEDSLPGLGRRVAQSGVLALSAQVIKFFISFGSTVILARLLTPEDYGVVAMIAVIYGFLTLFQYFGLPTAIIQWKALTHPEVSNLFWISVVL